MVLIGMLYILSIGAVFTLIPIIIIVLLIAAAVGLNRGSSIFALFGFDVLLGMGRHTGRRGLTGAKYQATRHTGKITGYTVKLKGLRQSLMKKKTGALAAEATRRGLLQMAKTDPKLALVLKRVARNPQLFTKITGKNTTLDMAALGKAKLSPKDRSSLLNAMNGLDRKTKGILQNYLNSQEFANISKSAGAMRPEMTTLRNWRTGVTTRLKSEPEHAAMGAMASTSARLALMGGRVKLTKNEEKNLLSAAAAKPEAFTRSAPTTKMVTDLNVKHPVHLTSPKSWINIANPVTLYTFGKGYAKSMAGKANPTVEVEVRPGFASAYAKQAALQAFSNNKASNWIIQGLGLEQVVRAFKMGSKSELSALTGLPPAQAPRYLQRVKQNAPPPTPSASSGTPPPSAPAPRPSGPSGPSETRGSSGAGGPSATPGPGGSPSAGGSTGAGTPSKSSSSKSSAAASEASPRPPSNDQEGSSAQRAPSRTPATPNTNAPTAGIVTPAQQLKALSEELVASVPIGAEDKIVRRGNVGNLPTPSSSMVDKETGKLNENAGIAFVQVRGKDGNVTVYVKDPLLEEGTVVEVGRTNAKGDYVYENENGKTFIIPVRGENKQQPPPSNQQPAASSSLPTPPSEERKPPPPAVPPVSPPQPAEETKVEAKASSTPLQPIKETNMAEKTQPIVQQPAVQMQPETAQQVVQPQKAPEKTSEQKQHELNSPVLAEQVRAQQREEEVRHTDETMQKIGQEFTTVRSTQTQKQEELINSAIGVIQRVYRENALTEEEKNILTTAWEKISTMPTGSSKQDSMLNLFAKEEQLVNKAHERREQQEKSIDNQINIVREAYERGIYTEERATEIINAWENARELSPDLKATRIKDLSELQKKDIGFELRPSKKNKGSSSKKDDEIVPA